MSKNFMGDIKDVARKAERWSLRCLTLVCMLISIAVMFIWVKDIERSYNGWGVKLLSIIDVGEDGHVFAGVISALSTLIQIAWYTALITGMKKIYLNRQFATIAIVATVFDNALDTNAMYVPDQGWGSILVSFAVTTVLFTFLSEALGGFFIPITLALLSVELESTDWSFSGQGSESQPSQRSSRPSIPRPQPSPMPTRPSPGPSPEAIKQREAMMRARSR